METKEKRSKYNHSHYIRNREKLLEKHAEWQKNNPERYSIYNQRWHRNLKKEVLEHYGGTKCANQECNETEIRKLQVDHINNDGAEHRRRLTGENSFYHFYRWLKKNGFPNDPPLQVLCRKCNQEKETKHMKELEAINGSDVWKGYDGVLNAPLKRFGLTREQRDED